MARRRKLALLRGDRSLWIIVAVLCVVSILVVYSSTASMAHRDMGGDTSHYVLRQVKFILFGFFFIIIVHWINYKFYIKFAKPLFWLSIGLAIMAHFDIFGVELNDAARWIRVPGLGLTFLPSDLLKISLVMLLASQLGQRQRDINHIDILPSLSPGGWSRQPQKNMDIYLNTTKPLVVPIAVGALVVMPANLSTAMMIVAISLVMLLVGRVQVSQIWKLLWVAVVTLLLVAGGMKLLGFGRVDTWINRIESFVEPVLGANSTTVKVPEDEFQKQQAKIAVASGGVFGKGPGNSTQRSQLPHPYSDFAYAFIIEEYGLVGGLVILTLYLWIFYRAGVIMKKSRKPAPSLLVLGLSLMITLQAFVNMAVSTGVVPVTGQTLPLISLGGSSVFFTCVAFGMILGVSRETDEEEEALLKAQALALKEAEEAELALQIAEIEEGREVVDRQKIVDEKLTSRSNEKLFASNDRLAQRSFEGDDDDPFVVVDHPHLDPLSGRNVEREVINLDDD